MPVRVRARAGARRHGRGGARRPAHGGGAPRRRAKEQVARGDWLVAPGSLKRVDDHRRALRAAARLPARVEGRDPRCVSTWARARRSGGWCCSRAHRSRAGGSALAQVLLEKPGVAARGDRFVIRAYSPSRTVGGGTIIEPVAAKRRRRAGGLESLAVHESGSLEARLLGAVRVRDARRSRPRSWRRRWGRRRRAVGRIRSTRLVADGPGGARRPRPVALRRTVERRARGHCVARSLRYSARLPARYGIPKGELKSGLKSSAWTASLFDAAFDALAAEDVLWRCAASACGPPGRPGEPPAAIVFSALERLEAELESAGPRGARDGGLAEQARRDRRRGACRSATSSAAWCA